jgi:hypothetical protein
MGMIGFSAGAHLVANAAMKASPGSPGAVDEAGQVSGRPNFLILVYGDAGQRGQPLMGLNKIFASQLSPTDWESIWSPTEKELASTPPTFMFCTSEDRGAAQGMADLYGRLIKAQVSTEFHAFAHGPHGVGLAEGDPVLGAWPGLLETWMRAGGYLTDAPKIPIRGVVRIDGIPLQLGHVVFTPLQSAHAAPQTAYMFNRTDLPGEFSLPAERGLSPGKYKVAVYQQSTNWHSVWVDPFLNGLARKAQTQATLNEDDLRTWKTKAATNRYHATIPDIRKLDRKHPRDRDPITIAIKAGPENRVDLELFSAK